MALDLKESLTTKLGPLPVVAWVGVPAVAYISYKWWVHKNSSAPVSEDISEQAYQDLGEADDFSNGYGNAAGDYNGSTAGNTYAPPAIADNSEWGRQVVNFLIATGVDPVKAKRVVNAFLYGTKDTLNTEEGAILNLALRQFGDPPDPVSTIPDVVEPPVQPNFPVEPAAGGKQPSTPKPPKPPDSWLTKGHRWVYDINAGGVWIQVPNTPGYMDNVGF